MKKEETMKRLNNYFTLSLIILIGILTTGVSFADEGRQYEVTITNVTRGQIITPPVLISHNGNFNLFTPGSTVIPEFEPLAEDGDATSLLAYLGTVDDVFEYAQAGGPIMPGASVTVEISTKGNFRYLSAAGMLASTNDAFFGLNKVKAPRHGIKSVTSPAYDAGSEANTESCDHIPGPPCGNHARTTNGAEGYVHVHAGIHGMGDLTPAMHDWRNPVAKITIRPVHQ